MTHRRTFSVDLDNAQPDVKPALTANGRCSVQVHSPIFKEIGFPVLNGIPAASAQKPSQVLDRLLGMSSHHLYTRHSLLVVTNINRRLDLAHERTGGAASVHEALLMRLSSIHARSSGLTNQPRISLPSTVLM